MGWASLLADSVKNPFTSFLGDSANAIRGVGVGLASGTDLNIGMANAAQYAAQGAQKDDAYATQKKDEAKRQEQLQKAVDNYRSAGMGDIADWLSNTGPDGLDLAAQQFWKRKEPGYGQTAPTPMEFRDVNGDIIGLNPVTGDSRMVYDGQPTPADAPSGYQWNPAKPGELMPIPNGPDDPAIRDASKPPTDAQRRSGALYSVVEPDAKLLLGDGTTPGVFDAMSNVVDQANPVSAWRAEDFQRAANAITNIAQSYLYAISGQAAPAEEVDKIVKLLTPTPLENAKSVADKKARLQTYVNAIKMGRAPGASGGATDPMGIRD